MRYEPYHDPDENDWSGAVDRLQTENKELRTALAEALDVARVGASTSAGTEAGATEEQGEPEPAPAHTEAPPTAPDPGEVQAAVDAIPITSTPDVFYAALHEAERRTTPAPPGVEPKPQLSGPELDKALDEADKETSWEGFYGKLHEAGALDETDKRVYRR